MTKENMAQIILHHLGLENLTGRDVHYVGNAWEYVICQVYNHHPGKGDNKLNWLGAEVELFFMHFYVKSSEFFQRKNMFNLKENKYKDEKKKDKDEPMGLSYLIQLRLLWK